MDSAPREHWQSGIGFLLASLGAAVGLGNVWRFSYVAGENGGGAFLLVYLLMVMVIGVPLLLAEFALGRSTQRESAAAIATLLPHSRWRHLGLLGVAIPSIVLAYYAVIAGWVFKYLAIYLLGQSAALAAQGPGHAFAQHLAMPLEPLIWQGLGLVLCVLVIARGVHKGIEKANLWLMPALALLLLFLAVRNTTLPGFAQALAFLFQPDWAVLLQPALYLAALGQALFSIGLAMGIMVTYGSYLGRQHALPRAALVVVAGDTLFALTAGLVIFPAVFSFGMDPAQGPGLAFVVLPQVFARMQGGQVFGTIFFLLLSIAALTSMISLLEVPVAYVTERFHRTRLQASLAVGALLFLIGLPASMGYGLLASLVPPGANSLLDLMDYLAVELLLPLNALLLCGLIGWVWPRAEAIGATGLRRAALGLLWWRCLRYLTLPLVAIVLVSSVA